MRIVFRDAPEKQSARHPWGHNPSFWRPQPVYGCAWKPGLVVCTDCLYLTFAATMAEDRTCYGCGPWHVPI